ncbi:DinB family protein [Marinoscillum sp.]|uniref:DinB family protein n=1 Tax=Marinoscillum sp. TaxID=2024838 RepID=UPI003BA8659A
MFDLEKAIEILERTPRTLEQLLDGLSSQWIMTNEGPGTWSPYDVVGHLIHGEKTDWIPRMLIILSEKEPKTFTPFDRFAQEKNSHGKTINELLTAFKNLRLHNLNTLKVQNISSEDLKKTGIHPDFGLVTLAQLLATWTVHDLNHLSQISRVMARQYSSEVGPWVQYLKILRS